MLKEKIDRVELRRFAVIIVLFFVAVGSRASILHAQSYAHYFFISAIFCMLYFMCPRLLHIFYCIMKECAKILGVLIKYIVLLVLFFGIFTPIGVLMRLCRIDLLERSIDEDRQSYWKEEPPDDYHPGLYERQY